MDEFELWEILYNTFPDNAYHHKLPRRLKVSRKPRYCDYPINYI